MFLYILYIYILGLSIYIIYADYNIYIKSIYTRIYTHYYIYILYMYILEIFSSKVVKVSKQVGFSLCALKDHLLLSGKCVHLVL